jgi:hypothetical protein
MRGALAPGNWPLGASCTAGLTRLESHLFGVTNGLVVQAASPTITILTHNFSKVLLWFIGWKMHSSSVANWEWVRSRGRLLREGYLIARDILYDSDYLGP